MNPGVLVEVWLMLHFVQYEEMYKQSIEDPSTFWGEIASQFYWKRKWDTSKPICSYNFDVRRGPISIEV